MGGDNKPTTPQSEDLNDAKKKLTHTGVPSSDLDKETIKKQIEEEKGGAFRGRR